MIEKTLAKIGEQFAPNELAYLALTAKVESAVRDKLAYCLHKEESLKEFVVLREWAKIDLVIISESQCREGKTSVGLQLKAKSSSYKIVKEVDELLHDARVDPPPILQTPP